MKNRTIKRKRHQASGKLTGREFNLTITALTNAGDGLGHIDEQVIFVPYTMPGDEVRVRVMQDKGSFLIADLLEVVCPGPDRIKPACEYFGQCGGCDWLHIPYELQLKEKVTHLCETLNRIGGLAELEIKEIIASPRHTNYRNRIQGQLKDGAFHYRRKGSNKLISIAECQIADELINLQLAKGFDRTGAGRVEIGVSDNKVTVVPLYNKQSNPLGFRQVNTEMGALLTELVLSALNDAEAGTIYDLYCGRGEWTNAIAQLSPDKTVLGIDAMADNITLAKSNARQLGIQNVEFIQAKVEEALDKIKVKNSHCIVDPPRAGLDAAVCSALCKRPAKGLIYVSCHAATLARDLKILVASGYEVSSIQPLDMFPQTSHLECVAKLSSSTR